MCLRYVSYYTFSIGFVLFIRYIATSCVHAYIILLKHLYMYARKIGYNFGNPPSGSPAINSYKILKHLDHHVGYFNLLDGYFATMQVNSPVS